MKVINANNIEKWMFDYFEGNLSFHEKIELESFVRQNPAYQTDFEAWSKAYVQTEPLVYANADTLIKKGFFEDKKLLVLFAFLIGSGILLQNLIPTELKSSLLTNNEKKETGLTESTYTKNETNTVVLDEVTTNTSGKLVFNNEVKGEEIYSDRETTSLKSLDKKNTVEVKIAPQTEAIDNFRGTKTQAKVISNSNEYTYKSAVSDLRNERQVEVMFSYSENNINSTNGYKNAQKYNSDDKFEIIEVADYKGGIVDYKKKNKNSFSHYKSKTLSKSLSRMLSKDLLLTVYNNRLTLKSNQMGLAINSAFVGNVGAPRFQLNYERLSFFNQNDFKFSFDNKIKNLNAGIGMVLSNETDYVFNKKQAEFIYAHWFNVGGIKLITGLKSGIHQTEVNWNGIGVSSLTARANDSVNNSTDIGFNIAPSLMVKLPFAYAGLQINDAYSSTNKFVNNYKSFEVQNKAAYSIVMGSDYRKNFGRKFVISPQVYIDIFNDSRKTKYTFSTTMQYSNFLVGAGYTNDKTFRAVVGFDVKGFRMAYNAQLDLDLYNVAGVDGVKHELAVQYIISKKKSGILLYD